MGAKNCLWSEPRDPFPRRGPRIAWLMRSIALACVCLLALAASACNSSPKHETERSTTTTSLPLPTKAVDDSTVWLCFPGVAPDPCAGDMTTTSIAPDGKRTVLHNADASDPPIDCFYVYPTVSNEKTPNADLSIQPAETNVALLQASPFSLDCRVYAPMYRQLTLSHLSGGAMGSVDEAYGDVLAAWKDYLQYYNDGRGVVLIGHSQGSVMLEILSATMIAKHPSQLDKIVSAIVLGGNVEVPTASAGKAPSTRAMGLSHGQDSMAMPACRSKRQIRCVVAYSSFDTEPPADSRFGRTTTPGTQVVCVNPVDPAAAVGKALPLNPFVPRTGDLALLGVDPTTTGISTPWVTYPGVFTAACEHRDGASWLQINGPTAAAEGSPYLSTPLGPTWGLHLVDPTIAMGDLVALVHDEAHAWVRTTTG